MRIDILTIFPEMLEGFFSAGVIGQAREKGLIEINLHNLRDFTTDKHRTVDDRPYGGGPGMVLKPEPFFRGVEHIRAQLPPGTKPRVILLSASGRLFTQKLAKELAKEASLILLCGRYEGVDERVLELCTDELSIGDFVLSGGELAAAVVAEAVCRLVPGVVGDYESVKDDAFYDENLVGPPQWTRPPVYRGLKVPEVLLTGDHKEIAEFRRQKRLEKTAKNRPDLLRR
jgi:tRNA (guanine37-N1)-methyltransferase